MSCVAIYVMKFQSLQSCLTEGWTDAQVEIVISMCISAKWRKPCGHLEPMQSKLGQF